MPLLFCIGLLESVLGFARLMLNHAQKIGDKGSMGRFIFKFSFLHILEIRSMHEYGTLESMP